MCKCLSKDKENKDLPRKKVKQVKKQLSYIGGRAVYIIKPQR